MALRLLHYSDLEALYDDPDRAGRFAALAQSLRARDGDALLVGSGDDTAPGVLSLVTGGRQALDLYRAVEPDVETFGNHDFDHGLEATRAMVRDSPQTWVASNVHVDGERFGRDAGVVPWTVVERGETRVGFFGVLDAVTSSLDPAAGALTVTDPVAAGREAVEALRDRGADHVVALSHLGRRDEAFAAAVDVDAVLGGHVSTERVDRLDGTLLTRPGANGRVILEVAVDDGFAVTRHELADAPDAPVAADVSAALRERLSAAGLDEVVATVESPVRRTERTVFGGESRIGNFVADAYRWAADADVGLQNSGAIREGPPLAGEVTVADLVGVVPFDEPVAVAELSGAELLDVFRAGGDVDVGFAEADWWHAHVSGARIVYDHDGGALVEATVDGEPVDPDATYTLATTDFLFHSEDEFPALEERHRADTLPVQHAVLADYAREVGVDPSVEGRIRRLGRDG